MTIKLGVRWGVKPPLLRREEKILYRNPIIEQIDDLNRGLVAYYNDDGKSAATWQDMVNYPNGKNNGTIYGATTPPPATPQALGYLFDGVDDYIDCGNGASLNITQAITVEAWIKGQALATDKGIISKYSFGTGKRSWFMTQTTTSKLSVTLSDDGTLNANHSKQYISSVNISNDIIYQVSFTFNGTNLILYINGVADPNPTKTVDDAITSIYQSDVNILIGRLIDAGYFFKGSIDEVRIFNRALSASEINLLFQRYRGKFGI